MIFNSPPFVNIEGMHFKDVTDITTFGHTYNYRDAVNLAKTGRITSSGTTRAVSTTKPTYGKRKRLRWDS